MTGPEMQVVVKISGPQGAGKSLFLAALKDFLSHNENFRADFRAASFELIDHQMEFKLRMRVEL